MNLLVGLLWLTTVIALLVATLVWRERSQPRGKYLLALLAGIALGSYFHGLGLLAPTLADKTWWNHAEYLGSVWVGGMLLLLSLACTNHERWLKPGLIGCLLAMPLFSLAANWSNEWHHLYYRSVYLERCWDIDFLHKRAGPLYLVFQVYSMGSAILSALLLLQHSRKVAHFYRGLYRVLFCTALTPLALNTLYLLHLIPHLDSSPVYLALLVTSILLWWAAGRGRMLEVDPIARTLLIEHMAEAVFVLDNQDRMTDFNLKAADWFGCTERMIGEPIAKLEGLKGFSGGIPAPASQLMKIGPRWYRANRTRLNTPGGKSLGTLCLCLDVTREQETEAALQEAYRERSQQLRQAMLEVARTQRDEQCRIGRDLHDTLCQDLAGVARSMGGLMARLQQTGGAAIIAEFQPLAAQLTRLTHSAREFAHDLSLMDLHHNSLPQALQYFADYAQSWHGIQVELNYDRQVELDSADMGSHLLSIIREAIVNAARHGKARQAWVDILQDEQSVTVSISNNGLPLPEAKHLSEGMGLRGIRMRTALLGGEFRLHNTPEGTVLLQLKFTLATQNPSEATRHGMDGEGI